MKKTISFILTLGLSVSLYAQTFNHDPTKMNQFLMQETGTGIFQPMSEWYYDLFHKGYKNTAIATNKTIYRTLTYEASLQQIDYADSIRSRLEARAKQEALNMADRKVDIAWITEQPKIENALNQYSNNLSLLSANGASAEEKDDWQEYANMYVFAISRTKEAYMSNSEREKEYLNIYDDIVKRNNRLVKRLRYLKTLRGTNEMLTAASVPRPNRVLQCANQSYNKWREAGSSVRSNRKNH